jgi:fanconi anemia group I protein
LNSFEIFFVLTIHVNLLTSDQQGQSQETVSLSSSSEVTHFHDSAMLGIIEILVDFAASKLNKATDESKEMTEKEILDLAGAHNCFERKTSNHRERTARRRGDVSDTTDKQTNEPRENSNAFMQKFHGKRGRFLDSNLYELAVLCVKQCSADSYDRCSQRPSQTKWKQSSSLVSLVLKASLELFKSPAAKESEDIIRNMRTMQDGDVKKLIQPIMQLFWCLMLDTVEENGGLKRNITQGKKNSENKKDQLYLALACLKELLKPSDSGDHSGGIIEVMISSAPPNVEDMMDASELLDKNDTATTVEDQNTRNAHMFLNILRNLYARILSQSLLRECKVNLSVIWAGK